MRTKNSYFSKFELIFHEKNDKYICPTNLASTTDVIPFSANTPKV